MDEQSARQILASLRGELEEAQRVAAAAAKRTAAIEKLVEGYLELFPALAEETPEPIIETVTVVLQPDRPVGQEAVLRAMQDPANKGRYWTVAAMTDDLDRRGWTPRSDDPASAVRTAMIRVERAHDHVKKGRGATGTIVYYFMTSDADVPTFSGEPLQLSPGGVSPDRLHYNAFADPEGVASG